MSCSPLPSDRDYLAELHRIVAAIDVRCDRLERLLTRFLAALEAHEGPTRPPTMPMH
jgi:hypothetical protein